MLELITNMSPMSKCHQTVHSQSTDFSFTLDFLDNNLHKELRATYIML